MKCHFILQNQCKIHSPKWPFPRFGWHSGRWVLICPQHDWDAPWLPAPAFSGWRPFWAKVEQCVRATSCNCLHMKLDFIVGSWITNVGNCIIYYLPFIWCACQPIDVEAGSRMVVVVVVVVVVVWDLNSLNTCPFNVGTTAVHTSDVPYTCRMLASPGQAALRCPTGPVKFKVSGGPNNVLML